jgi:inner membrane protein
MMPSTDWIGWLATAVFVSSYFSKQPQTLRRLQGVAASLWGVYGALIGAMPVLVANVIVAGVAIGSSFRRTASARPGGGSAGL